MDTRSSGNKELKSLPESFREFIASFTPLPATYAILYAPGRCTLGLVESGPNGTASVKDHRGEVSLDAVFEARIFNAEKELRWLRGHGSAILSDASFPDAIETILQQYLLWGQSTKKTDGSWTEFASARIGPYGVPLGNIGEKKYAIIEAIEYVKKSDEADGNAAIIDERLTGIAVYTEGEHHG